MVDPFDCSILLRGLVTTVDSTCGYPHIFSSTCVSPLPHCIRTYLFRFCVYRRISPFCNSRVYFVYLCNHLYLALAIIPWLFPLSLTVHFLEVGYFLRFSGSGLVFCLCWLAFRWGFFYSPFIHLLVLMGCGGALCGLVFVLAGYTFVALLFPPFSPLFFVYETKKTGSSFVG